jgi:hypothetical protein
MNNTGEFRSPYMAVPCPTCGAKVGRWCKRPSGHSGPMVAFHAARRKAAEEAEAAGGVRLGTPALRGTVRWALAASRRVGNMWPGDTATLCLVRMDDFYNAFDQDAVVLAEALDVALTRIQYDGLAVPMCGVAADAATDAFARLVAGGWRLVVVEQDDTAVVWTATEPKPVQLALF